MTALLLLGMSTFAEIVLKDLGGGKVSITFLFKHSASEMNVIGSFDNWTVPGEAMTKNADGLWEYTLEAMATDEIQYKFFVKDVWIFDDQAPDKKDDGYGGNNGLIVVADILSGATPMKPGAAAVAVAAPAGATGTVIAPRKKVQFGTETYFDSTTVLGTVSGDEEFVESDINAKSIWKFDGDLVPNLPGHLEITAMDGQTKFMTEADADNAYDGIEAASTGFIVNPFYYFGGNKRPSLASLSFGIEGSYLEWQTGYMDAGLPARNSYVWETVDPDNKAGEGYSLFRLGSKLRAFGDFEFDAAVMPNKSLDGYFGYLAWLKASYYGVALDFQYDNRSNEKTDSSLYFDVSMRQDYIAGIQLVQDWYYLRGQYLLSRFAPDGAVDNSAAAKRSAYKAVLGMDDPGLGVKASVSYANRGEFAQLLYGDSDDQLGDPMYQKVAVSGAYRYTYSASWFLDADAQTASDSDNADENVAVTVKPAVELDLKTYINVPAKLNAYVKGFYNTDPASGTDAMGMNSAGAKLAFEKYNLYYKLDNGTADCMFNTLLVDTTVVEGVTLQAGAGVRTGSAANTNAAFTLGAFKTLDAPQAKSPTVYAQFLYNMDPYDGTAEHDFDLDGYGPDSGATALDGLANIRFGISWNY